MRTRLYRSLALTALSDIVSTALPGDRPISQSDPCRVVKSELI